MDVSRELDALIAEKVFGYTLDYEFAEITGAPNVKELRDQCDEWGLLPHYSTDIAAAWLIVEKFGDFEIGLTAQGVSVCLGGGEYSWAGEYDGRTEPTHAICLAALKAIGYTKDDHGR